MKDAAYNGILTVMNVVLALSNPETAVVHWVCAGICGACAISLFIIDRKGW